MKVPVVWLSLNPETPGRGYWDQGILEDVFSNNYWYTGFEFQHLESINEVYPYNNGAIVVFPARAQVDYVDELNNQLNNLEWVVLMLTGDEEATFPVEKIKHKNIKIYVMSPRKGIHDNYGKLGTGYPPQLRNYVHNIVPHKTQDWFFAGQITHPARIECANKLRDLEDGTLIETEGFTQGIPHKDYYNYLAKTKVAPCPSGPQTPDTFRLFEALETACVPIADVMAKDFEHDYWNWFFDEEVPFPVIDNYDQLPGYMEDTINKFPTINNRVFAWWVKKKRQFVQDLVSHIKNELNISPITIIIPTSPIKSHPDISILEETIISARHHLPNADIILTFDGVRPEKEDKRADYEEFIRRILWKCNYEYKNVLPLIFDEHMHQTGMAKVALKYVTTPLILYMEQDTPLVTDYEINFEQLSTDMILGHSNLIRFHFEASIPKDHSHMVHGSDARTESPLLMTSQWSQRPHLATTAFYRRILNDYFSKDAKSFIEDKMHGVLHEAFLIDGMLGWEQFKVHIYYPEGNIKRSYHTDGRAGEEKYDDSQVF